MFCKIGNSSGDPRDVRGSILLQYPYQETLRGMFLVIIIDIPAFVF